jgi:hypothetical protein
VTDEEVARFALILSEADRLRAQIAEDEAAARKAADVESPLPAAPPTVEHPPMIAAVAAAWLARCPKAAC